MIGGGGGDSGVAVRGGGDSRGGGGGRGGGARGGGGWGGGGHVGDAAHGGGRSDGPKQTRASRARIERDQVADAWRDPTHLLEARDCAGARVLAGARERREAFAVVPEEVCDSRAQVRVR